MILPQMEEQALLDSFDLTLPISHRNNRIPRGQTIPTMLCPSDEGHGTPFSRSREGDNWARGNYGANGCLGAYATNWSGRSGAGPTAEMWLSTLTGGVMGANVARSISEITDGTSQTILLGELRVGLAEVDRRGVWALGGPGASSFWMHGSDDAIGPNSCYWSSDNLRNPQEIIQAVGLEKLRRECMTVCASCPSDTQAAPRSVHEGGAYFCMADSSVRFISETIEAATAWQISREEHLATWQRLNAARDGQVIDAGKM
jgi:hypothetical protein